MTDFRSHIAKVAAGQSLDADESRQAFDILMSGMATPSQIGGFLMALRVRGETVAEISGAVGSMRARMLKVDAPDNAVDIVGTGGDSSGSYNVSTLAAIIVAATGIPVAKHGNRALSSRSGAADALASLGVNIEAGPEIIAACIREAGVGFMFAPTHHSAMRHVAPTRIELGTRTIFNLLGPLGNPAGVRRQLLGVYSPQWLEPLAEVLRVLGSEAVWVVHGEGLDEMTTTGTTQVAELKDGVIRTFEITPEDAGLKRAAMAELKGGDGEHNAAALREVLLGARNAYRDIAVLNAAGALVVAGSASSLREGVDLASDAIDSGAAAAVLARLVEVSNRKTGKDG